MTHFQARVRERYRRSMMAGDIERTAELLYRAAGCDVASPAPPGLLIERLLGPRAVRLVPERALPAEAAIVRVGQAWKIFVCATLRPEQRRFVALHELAHWAIGLRAAESDCDALAAALLVPRGAFLRAVRAKGGRIATLAATFKTTHSFAALRLGETTHRPVALVTAESIRTRGAAYTWPSGAQLLRAARGDLPGIRKIGLPDDPGRVALRPTRPFFDVSCG